MNHAEEGKSSLLRVMALHALAYCERLFCFEEVEEIRVADANVYAGRRLHAELEDNETLETLELADEELGLTGKLDAVRNRNGEIYPYEHKRGRSNNGAAWRSDRIQVSAYAMLLERSIQRPVTQGRIRYHRDSKTVIVPVDEEAKREVIESIERAREIRESPFRPPVTENERLCIACSLAPICLPEETRKAKDVAYDTIRLFPPHPDKQTVHVIGHGDRLGRSGEAIKIQTRGGGDVILPTEDVREIVLHGNAQASTQALSLCAWRDIPVHWISAGGNYQFSLTNGIGGVRRRIRQYVYLANAENALSLAKRTVANRMENQYQALMRQTRENRPARNAVRKHLDQIKRLKSRTGEANNPDTLRGFEGACSNTYFSALRTVLDASLPEPFRFSKRTRRPPRDRFNAILSFGYSLLQRSVMSSILIVGLEPSLGYYHTPRSSAHPLALDLMELFRVIVWDVTVIGSLKRNAWDAEKDFQITPGQVWLSDSGRRKAIEFFENLLNETWKHPMLGYSLSYGRHIELETRLLEKVWTEGSSPFATTTIR